MKQPSLAGAAVLLLMGTGGPADGQNAGPATIRVPGDRPTIQAAVDAARDGDTVLVAPGTYRESLKIAGKSVTLASRFLTTKDPDDVERTILDGGGTGKKDGEVIVTVGKSGGAGSKIVGFTIRRGAYGITCSGKVEVLHNRFSQNGDALSFESGRGVVRSNVFEDNADDGIDLDGSSEASIEENVIRGNRDDGIEIRLHKHTGPLLTILIRGNVITGNREDGIQLIDYPGKSNRIFRIERNLISKTAMAALGCMGDGVTQENYEGADLLEPVYVINNTFADNHYGVTGGDNMVLVNNVFVGTRMSSLKKVDGDSIASHNLVWKNGRDLESCDLDRDTLFSKDPVLDPEYRPAPGSPCIDGGTAAFEKDGREVTLAPAAYSGAAPDLGAFEAKP